MRHFEKVAHSFLILGFLAGVIALWGWRFDSRKQFVVLLILAAFYLIWGFGYHHLRGDLKRRLIFEYLLVAAIATVGGFLVLVR